MPYVDGRLAAVAIAAVFALVAIVAGRSGGGTT
jgi:hypothetical protein